jgi:glycosyltransferase involved in cell wall biosynthesis
MEAAYAQMDVLLSCSHQEAFGRSLAEAAFHGIPVIAKSGGGVQEIVTDAGIGYLYNNSDELLACAQKVLDKLSRYHEHPEPWVLPASLQRFTINRYVSEMDTLIEGTLKAAGKK